METSITKVYSDDDIFKYLDFLSSKSGATNQEKTHLAELSSKDSETQEVIRRIITKDLRCGASLGLFSKIFKDLPQFELMTCVKNIDRFLTIAKKINSPIYWCIKKDGARTLSVIDNDKNIKYLSRSGLPFYNFSEYNDEILLLHQEACKLLKLSNCPIDGESTDSVGNFNTTMTGLRTKDKKENLQYVFNIFDLAITGVPFYKRQEILENIFSNNHFTSLKLIEHTLLTQDQMNKEEILKIMNDVVSAGEEGIVLKIGNSPYEFKEKSKFWLKVKPEDTYDLLVVGKFLGKKGTKYESLLGGLVLQFQDKQVSVGSGFSDEQRSFFLKNTPGMVEIKCKGITPAGSLREPIFVRIRDDKYTVSDES